MLNEDFPCELHYAAGNETTGVASQPLLQSFACIKRGKEMESKNYHLAQSLSLTMHVGYPIKH